MGLSSNFKSPSGSLLIRVFCPNPNSDLLVSYRLSFYLDASIFWDSIIFISPILYLSDLNGFNDSKSESKPKKPPFVLVKTLLFKSDDYYDELISLFFSIIYV